LKIKLNELISAKDKWSVKLKSNCEPESQSPVTKLVVRLRVNSDINEGQLNLNEMNFEVIVTRLVSDWLD